jgi:phosphatidylglycerophosphatase A
MWPASGTWGSLPPTLLFAGMAAMHASIGWHVAVQAALALAASVACIRHGHAAERVTGRKDPGVVVIDEVAGMSLTLVVTLPLLLVLDGQSGRWAQPLPMSLALVLACGCFAWFRVMDVIKPPPARGLQSLPAGVGVLVDDLVVAPYAAAACIASIEIWVRWLTPVG